MSDLFIEHCYFNYQDDHEIQFFSNTTMEY